MRKKFSAICLATIIYLLSAATAFGSGKEEFKTNASDEFCGLMSYLGVLEVDCDFSKEVTRAQLAKMLCTLADIHGGENEMSFSDVSNETENYIGAVSAAGVMQGVSENVFGSDSIIDFNQAQAAIINLLGYKEIAMYNGGYPTGYLMTGAQLGLFKGVNIEKFTLADAVKLLENACEADVRMVIGFADNNLLYKIKEDDTVLSVYHNIYSGSGTVTGNSVASISGNDLCSDLQIEIDGLRHIYSGDKEFELLGYKTKYFYLAEDAGEEIVAIAKDSAKNKTEKYDAEDFLGIESGKMSFLDGEDVKKLNVENCKLIINNQIVDTINEDDLYFKNGSFTLLDSDCNGVYETVTITKIESSVVAGIDPVDYTIFFNADYSKHCRTKLSVDTMDSGAYFKFYFADENGVLSEIEIDEIKKGMVASLIASENNRYAELIVTFKEENGYISEIYDDKLVIDGAEYKYIKKENADIITVGLRYSYILDYYGNIVSIESAGGGLFYAYIFDGIIKEGLNASIKFHAMTAGGAMVAECAEDIYIDGERVKLSKNNAKLSALFSGGKAIGQMVRMGLDDNDKIYCIDTAFDNNPKSEKNTLKLHEKGRKQYNQRMKSFTDVYKIENTFALFTLDKPEDAKSEDDFKIVGALKHEENYYVDIYDVSDAGEIGAMLIKSTADVGGGSLMGTNPLGVVISGFKGINKDEEVASGVKIYKDGKIKSYFFEQKKYGNSYSPKLNFGDIIRISLNAKDEIVDYAIEFDTEAKKVRTNKINNSFMLYGMVYAKGSSNFAIINGNDVDPQNINLSLRKVVPSPGGTYTAINMDKKAVWGIDYSLIPDGVSKNPNSVYYVFTETEYYGTLVNVFLYLGGEQG